MVWNCIFNKSLWSWIGNLFTLLSRLQTCSLASLIGNHSSSNCFFTVIEALTWLYIARNPLTPAITIYIANWVFHNLLHYFCMVELQALWGAHNGVRFLAAPAKRNTQCMYPIHHSVTLSHCHCPNVHHHSSVHTLSHLFQNHNPLHLILITVTHLRALRIIGLDEDFEYFDLEEADGNFFLNVFNCGGVPLSLIFLYLLRGSFSTLQWGSVIIIVC